MQRSLFRFAFCGLLGAFVLVFALRTSGVAKISAAPKLTATPTATNTTFQDVPTTSPNYPADNFVVKKDMINAVTCGAADYPCGAPGNYSYFAPTAPFSTASREQVAKIVVIGANLTLVNTSTPSFSDVPSDSPYFAYIETAYRHGIIGGYQDGTFRPANAITRGQVAKVIVLAKNWPIVTPSVPSFSDVPPSNAFYSFIETQYAHQVMLGSSCGANCRVFYPSRNLSDSIRGDAALYLARAFCDCSAPLGDEATFTPTTSPTATQTPPTTQTPTSTATPVAFTDVAPSDYFYQPVQYLVARGAVSGYADNTFRPYNNTTRGQLAKIVALSFGVPAYTPPNGAQSFSDVAPSSPFFTMVESAVHANIISGYSDHTFRPNAEITRGQLAKIIVRAAGWDLVTPNTPTFADVYPGANPFFAYIETAYAHGIISGYVNPNNPTELEFRWANSATRGQIAKIVYLAVTETGK